MIPSDKTETAASFDQLAEVIRAGHRQGVFGKTRHLMPGIIGGWAVYFTVNSHWTERFGREYLGSRDIDMFLHCEEDRQEKMHHLLADIGYKPIGCGRYMKELGREGGGPAIEHYIDLFCDMSCKNDVFPGPTCRCQRFESLRGIFEHAKELELSFGGILIPSIDLLAGMKVDAIISPDRSPEKRMKDMCDLTALLLHPGFTRDAIESDGRIGIGLNYLLAGHRVDDVSLHLFEEADGKLLRIQLERKRKGL